MQREVKTFTAEVKAGSDLQPGEFTAVVSVFGNVDLGGDRIVKGAFAQSLAAMKASGDVLPIVWSHDWDNPHAHIGYADPADIVETDEGLQLKGRLDVDRPFAEQVAHLLKTRRVKEFSFGYFVRQSDTVDDPEYGKVRELTDIDIFEAGPTLKGMNPDTRLLEAASALREQTAAEAPAPAEAKAIDVPEYVSENAARGLAYYEDGYGGDGLVEATVRAARDMAGGSVSEDKVRKIGPWIARHIVDLDAPQNSDPNDPDYPGAGLVAMLLWGAGPDAEGARRTQAWAEQEVARLDEGKSETPNDTDAPAVDASGDTQSTIDTERLAQLLVMPRNKE
jgi:HK97 family phage prohead protease